MSNTMKSQINSSNIILATWSIYYLTKQPDTEKANWLELYKCWSLEGK